MGGSCRGPYYHSLQMVNGCYAMPRALVQNLIEVIGACVEGIPFVPVDEANMPARGLGSMVAFWERMRNICPKVNLYHGPIYDKDGGQCATSTDLDEISGFNHRTTMTLPGSQCWIAMLLWDPWPPLCPPDADAFLSTLLHTKDSAPGPDGLPYSAWRLLPSVTVDVMINYFYDIVNGTAFHLTKLECVFFWLDAAWVKSRAERPSVSGVNRQLHVQIGCKLRIGNRKDELTKQAKRNKLRIIFFFALCCFGKIPGGAPFSQLHKSGNGSRVDRP